MGPGEQPRYAYLHRARGVPVMAGPQDPAAAGRDRLRAGHADREQVIETLKDAFVHGRLAKDELDARAGRALSAQTYADLAALTADIPAAPSAPPAAGLARPPAPARRWPLARAAAKSGGCLAFAFALVLFAANVLDPNGLGNPYAPWSSLCAVAALIAVVVAFGFLANGVATSVEQRHSRRQLPPPGGAGRPRPGRRTAGRHRPSPGSPRPRHRPGPRRAAV
jgi:DUF1707 SHOCT-like domain